MVRQAGLQLNGAELLTVKEVAKALRISKNLVYALVAQGEIPSTRLGRLIRIPRALLEERMLSGDHERGDADATYPPTPNR